MGQAEDALSKAASCLQAKWPFGLVISIQPNDGLISSSPVAGAGSRQGSCRVIHAAESSMSATGLFALTTESRSELGVAGPMGDQSRVEPV